MELNDLLKLVLTEGNLAVFRRYYLNMLLACDSEGAFAPVEYWSGCKVYTTLLNLQKKIYIKKCNQDKCCQTK